MKIKAVAATTFEDPEKGWSYAESALMDLAKSAGGKPIFVDIDKRIGTVESGVYEDGKVVIFAALDRENETFARSHYLVPGGLVDYQKDGAIISKCTAIQYTVTDRPGDETLTPIEIIE